MSKDKVIFYDDERLDIPDANALQDLIYNYLDRAFGSLIGLSQGIAVGERFLISTANNALPHEYRLDDCVIYKCIDAGVSVVPESGAQNVRAGSIGRTGVFVRHDRNINDIVFDFGVLQVTSTPGFIFAKVSNIDTDIDTRRKWDANLGTEVTFSDETIRRPYISEINVVGYTGPPAAAPAAPDNSGDWCLIGKVKWSGGVADLTPIWAFSYYQTIGQLDLIDPNTNATPELHAKTKRVWSATNIDEYPLNPIVTDVQADENQLFTDVGYLGDSADAFHPDSSLCTSQYGSHGLAHQLHVIRLQLSRILHFDPDSTSTYYKYPDSLRVNSDNTLTNTRFHSIPRVTLGDVAEMLGDADTCYKARTFDIASPESEAWMPLVESPKFAYGNPSSQDYFIYANGWVVGGGSGSSTPNTDWLATATMKEMYGMTILQWMANSYVLHLGNWVHYFGQMRIQLDTPPVYKDSKGIDRSVQLVSVNLAVTNTQGLIDGTATLTPALRVYNTPNWGVEGPANASGNLWAPWSEYGTLNASDASPTVIALNYEYKIMDYHGGLPSGNNYFANDISLGLTVNARLTT